MIYAHNHTEDIRYDRNSICPDTSLILVLFHFRLKILLNCLKMAKKIV